jgi:D-lyxose ketol-isomerase
MKLLIYRHTVSLFCRGKKKNPIKREKYEHACKRALEYFQIAGIALAEKGKENFEAADCGLDALERMGLELVTCLNTKRCCAKGLGHFSGQTCPEHRHPMVSGETGKEETFRCRRGSVTRYIPDKPAQSPVGRPPKGDETNYSVFHEIKLDPGEQYTPKPDTLHCFRTGRRARPCPGFLQPAAVKPTFLQIRASGGCQKSSKFILSVPARIANGAFSSTGQKSPTRKAEARPGSRPPQPRRPEGRRPEARQALPFPSSLPAR